MPLLKDAAVAARDAGLDLLKERIKDRMSRKEKDEEETPSALVDPEELEKIRQEALAVALEWRVSPDKARKMADALVGRLATLSA